MYYGELENSQLNIWGGVALTVVIWLVFFLLWLTPVNTTVKRDAKF